MPYTPQNWADILDDQVVTHGEILLRIAANELAPKYLVDLQAEPDKGITYFRFMNAAWGVPLNKFNNDVLVKKDIVGWKSFLRLEHGTCTKAVYDDLQPADRANLAYYNTTPTAASYVAGTQFVYGMMLTNRDNANGGSGYAALGLPTQGNIVITLTLPENTSFAGINYQWLTAGTDVTHTISGQVLTVTISKSIDVYNSQPPYNVGYHIGVILNSTVPTTGTSPKSIYFNPTVTCAYTVNSPLTPTSFEARLLFGSLSLSKTNAYAGTIPYNQVFNYTITVQAATLNATGVVLTDTLPFGLTYQGITLPAGWTSSLSGSTVTINSNGNSVNIGSTYTVLISVKATSENTNISNTVTATSTNAGTASSTKTNYIDYNRTPVYTSQGFTTCYSGSNLAVYRDTNTYSLTLNVYFVLSGSSYISLNTTVAPSSAACYWDSEYRAATLISSTTRTRNNCPVGSSASTVTINPGDVFGISPSGQIRSYVSQADANSQAEAYAEAQLQTNLQTYANTVGTCTWCANDVSASYTGYFTRNNCGTDCYATGTVALSSTQTRSACSTVSSSDANTQAYNTAYQAAVDYVNANGQSNANTYGTCCCWVLSYYCEGSGCQRRSIETNSCTGETRNDTYVADNSCLCGPQCQGTYWSSTDWFCSGTTKVVYEYYYCTNARTGTTRNEACACGTEPANWVYQYDTCLSGVTYPVYRDLAPCSTSYNKYKANELQQDGMYTVGACGYSCNNATYRLENTSGFAIYDINYGICSDAIVRTITVNPGQVTFVCVAVNGGITLMDGSGSSFGSMIVTKVNDNCVI